MPPAKPTPKVNFPPAALLERTRVTAVPPEHDLRTVRGFSALPGVDFGIDFDSLELPPGPPPALVGSGAPGLRGAPWRSWRPPLAPPSVTSAPWKTVVAVGWLTAGRR